MKALSKLLVRLQSFFWQTWEMQQVRVNPLIEFEEPMNKPTCEPTHKPTNEQMNDQPTISDNALLLNNKPSSTHQLVVASITNIDSQGSANDGTTYFKQLSLPNDSPAKQHPVPNDGCVITTLSFVHLQVPFRTIGFYHPKTLLGNTDLYPSGVVHANIGQKLLNCYPLRVFSGDQ
jgi:hypothetical protein